MRCFLSCVSYGDRATTRFIMQLRYYVLLALLPSAIVATFCTRIHYRNRKPITYRECCPGYKGVSHDGLASCVPSCHEDCGNGTCSNPNSCSCHSGYNNLDHNPAKRCVPVCMGGCGQGQCVAPETCHCDDGYQLDDLRHRCMPICSSGCPNGRCEAPGKCSCNAGYSQAENQTDAACLAVCAPGCGKLRSCVAPNRCECVEGYIAIGDVCSLPDAVPINRFNVRQWKILLAVCVLSLLILIAAVCIITSAKKRRNKRQIAARKESSMPLSMYENNAYGGSSLQETLNY